MARYVIDLDSTIINTSRSIINLHNKLNDTKIEYVENHSWDFKEMVSKEELPKLFKLFDHEDFYDNSTLVVYDNAIKIINELSMQNEVVICSKHDSIRRNITSKWIYETFPTVDIMFTDTFDKSIVGHVDIVIDDKPEALLSVDADYKILFGTYDWNKDVNILRASDWSELYKMIKNIENIIDSNNKLINYERVGIKRWEF